MFRTIFEKENKQWHGMDESIIYHKDISLGNVLLQTMRLSPKKVVQVNPHYNIYNIHIHTHIHI